MTGKKIDAPLGRTRVRYSPRVPSLTATALDALDVWFDKHPTAYVAVSGGKDSTVCLHLARQVKPDVKAVFFDSGLEFPQTIKYLHRLTDAWEVDLVTYPAEPSALDVMASNGTWEHGVPKVAKDDLHDACILRPLARAQADFGRASVYGLRADESKTRLFLLSKAKGHVVKHDRAGNVEQEYLAPIWRWGFDEVHAYISQNGLPLNPIYRRLVELGVPERRARVGMLVDGWALDQGRWALARAIAPDLCRQVEARMPSLAEYR